MDAFCEGSVVHHFPVGIRILHQRTKNGRTEVERFMVAHKNGQSQWLGSRLHQGNGLRVTCSDTKKAVALFLRPNTR